jgi:hypothetical protein
VSDGAKQGLVWKVGWNLACEENGKIAGDQAGWKGRASAVIGKRIGELGYCEMRRRNHPEAMPPRMRVRWEGAALSQTVLRPGWGADPIKSESAEAG